MSRSQRLLPESASAAACAAPPARTVRSYVLRSGRITRAQRRALEEHWTCWGIETMQRVDLNLLFGRCAPRILEVGFGSGTSLLAMARLMPHFDFIGVEVYSSSIGRLLREIARLEINNIRVWRGDASLVLEQGIAAGVLEAVQIFFPDPWPKRRHHKRRLVQSDFLQQCASRLRPGGMLHLATDWEPYAREMLSATEAEISFENAAGAGRFAPRAPWRPRTGFEVRAQHAGRAVHELVFVRRRERNTGAAVQRDDNGLLPASR